jgi:hypothetical protein
MNRLALTAALVLTVAATAPAQTGLAGKWQGDTDGGAAIVLDLAVAKEALTGTLTRDGQSSPLSDGKVAKTTFTFKATLGGKDETFSGELKGDELRLWLDRQGPAKAVLFTRVKAKPSKH